jgi:murein tripeptide amidase MpaA
MASTSTIGTSTGGRDIKIIHLSTNKTAGKKTLWFDGGLHARYVNVLAMVDNGLMLIFWMCDLLYQRVGHYSNCDLHRRHALERLWYQL